jgi:2,4-dienoyl-CoA reductase-like NADH-dependent reductase (Old Yellow Enzyme family)
LLIECVLKSSMMMLFSPLQVNDVVFKNRLAVSPMCQYSAHDGFVFDWHLVHYGALAKGGAGLVMLEATAVSPEGRISPADLGIWSDEHLSGLQRIVGFIHQQGAVAGVQLAHAGRKASTSPPQFGGKQLVSGEGGWQTVAPSAIPFRAGEMEPEALSHGQMDQIVENFAMAAKRALQAGFKLIEIHGAHGYLLHQFLSPLTNQRTDEYGGAFENRIRLVMRVVEAIRKVWPQENVLIVRLSVTDWVDGGWNLNETLKLVRLLKEAGVDLIDCSSGGTVPDAIIPAAPGYQVPFAAEIRKAGLLTGAVGLITKASQANEIVKSGQADLVFMGREMLRDPHFPLRAAHELQVQVEWPRQYTRGKWE